MIGAGTAADPRRPMFVPVPAPGKTPERGGIVAFTAQISDDGQHAIVELVARDRAAFASVFDSRLEDVKVFERGKSRKDDVEQEIRKYKRDFDWKHWGVALP